MLDAIILFAFIGWLMVSSYISVHADSNGKSPFWGVGVFFFGIFGLLGYAISLASD
jgi:hypothetical protein